jgi:hypothetical protein
MIGHILHALAIQLLVKLLARSGAAGAAAASAWFISREITQAEYRWIEQFGGGLRANMPWWGGLDPRVWQHLDPWIDWIAPSLVVVAIAIAAERRKRTSQRIAKN